MALVYPVMSMVNSPPRCVLPFPALHFTAPSTFVVVLERDNGRVVIVVEAKSSWLLNCVQAMNQLLTMMIYDSSSKNSSMQEVLEMPWPPLARTRRGLCKIILFLVPQSVHQKLTNSYGRQLYNPPGTMDTEMGEWLKLQNKPMEVILHCRLFFLSQIWNLDSFQNMAREQQLRSVPRQTAFETPLPCEVTPKWQLNVGRNFFNDVP